MAAIGREPRPSLLRVMLLAAVAWVVGCAKGGSWFGTPQTQPMERLIGKAPPPDSFVGDHVQVANQNPLRVFGVGLVNGLDHTGGPAPPGSTRQIMLDRMRKMNVEDPERLLSSRQTALVTVEGFIPAGARPGARFDLTVRPVPGDTQTESLEGGWLLETPLAEYVVGPGPEGQPLEGKVLAVGEGPVFVTPEFYGRKRSARELCQGTVLGGGKSKIRRDLVLLLRPESRGVRTSRQIGLRINDRFYVLGPDGRPQGMATPQDDLRITLEIPEAYQRSWYRYCQVAALVAMTDRPDRREARFDRLVRQMNCPTPPEEAERAALEMEAIGPAARPRLRQVLETGSPRARLLAADVLAFLDDEAGLSVLTQTVETGTDTEQSLALAALVQLDSPASRMALQRALCHARVSVRVAAFEGLRRLGDASVASPPEASTGAIEVHEVECPGEPLIHVRRRERAQVLLMGPPMRLKPPVRIELARFTLNARESDTQCAVARLSLKRDPAGRILAPSTARAQGDLRVAELIRLMIRMQATYGEVVAMLDHAVRGKMLAARLVLEDVTGLIPRAEPVPGPGAPPGPSESTGPGTRSTPPAPAGRPK